MKNAIFKDENGEWKANFAIKKDNLYIQSFIKYLNILDPLFTLAKEKNDFEFICTLLRYRGNEDAGWDPFENLETIYYEFKKNYKNDTTGNHDHYVLFLYGLIIEASEPYELLANCINIINGDRYLIKNFHDNTVRGTKKIPQNPTDKIAQLKSKAKKKKLNLNLFDDFFDNNLRNSIFHSDYHIYNGELRIKNPDKKYKRVEWVEIINKSFAYVEAILHLYHAFIESYNKPELIDIYPNFSNTPGEKSTTIIREKYGLIGIKDVLTKEELSKGCIPHRLGRFLNYELSLIEDGYLLLPKNILKKFNNSIKFLPSFIKKILVKYTSSWYTKLNIKIFKIKNKKI